MKTIARAGLKRTAIRDRDSRRGACTLIELLVIIAGLAVGAAVASGAETSSTTNRQPRVLILYSNERLLPANIAVDEAMRATFNAELAGPVEFYTEFLDVDRFPGAPQEERTRNFLVDKYRERPPDVIIAAGGAALGFLVKHRADLFPRLPVVHCLVEPNESPASWPDDLIVGLIHKVDVVGTLELALRLQPDTRRVVIVRGISSSDRLTEADVSAVTAPLTFLWLTNLTIPELRAELAQLPDHTVVLYATMFRDPNGNSFTPRAALDQFTSASRVPIYGYYDTYLGHGIVGGSMITFETLGRSAAQTAIRILQGETPQAAVRGAALVPTPMFDARQLQRWNLSEDRLPPGAEIRFREPSLWEDHKRAILGAILLVFVEAALIAGLILQLRRRRRVESALRESEQRFRSLADTEPVMVWMSGPDQKCVYFNRRWLDFTGRPLEAEVGDGWTDNVHPDDVRARVEGYREAFAARTPLTVEYRLRRHDGQYRWILVQALPRLTAQGELLGYVGSCVDLTDRKQIEEANQHFAHLARVSTMGQLATTLAHELNQPLGAILRNAEAGELMLNQAAPDYAEIGAILTDIRLDDQRAGAVIERMRTFLKRRALELEPLQLPQVLGQVEVLVRAELRARRVSLHVNLPADLPIIRGDRVQLQQVLLNLLMNGADALSGATSGNRRLEVQARRLDAETVEVAIRDRGTGIPAASLPTLFEPFVSTKGNGLGMGLAISRTIIEAHGGRIRAENNLEGGATFRFTLKVAGGQ